MLSILVAISKIKKGNRVEAKINAVKENTCDGTVRELTEQIKQNGVFSNVRTGATFYDTKTPKLLSKLIPYIKSHENVSENAKRELFTAMTTSEYFRPSPKHNDPEHDRLIQASLLNMQITEHIQQMDNEMLEFQLQQQMIDQQFQQQQLDQANQINDIL